jgi:DNA repair photolyase
VLRLPYAVAPLFEDWLGRHFPDGKEKVLNRIRALRGGKLNNAEFGSRMKGDGIFAGPAGRSWSWSWISIKREGAELQRRREGN